MASRSRARPNTRRFPKHQDQRESTAAADDDDLKDIGVSALGDRIQLLDAIAALAGAKPTADVRASRPTPPKGPAISAESRPITVMFYDLVRSTSMAAKRDAED